MTSASNLRLVNKNVPPAAPYFCVYRIIRLIGKKPLERKEGNRGQPLLDSAFKLCGKWSNRRSPPTSTYTKCASLISGTSSEREKRKLRKISSRFHSGLVFLSLRVTFFLLAIGFLRNSLCHRRPSWHEIRDLECKVFLFFSFPVNLLIGKQAREREGDNGRRERRYLISEREQRAWEFLIRSSPFTAWEYLMEWGTICSTYNNTFRRALCWVYSRSVRARVNTQ
jgi:hypothetical protein